MVGSKEVNDQVEAAMREVVAVLRDRLPGVLIQEIRLLHPKSEGLSHIYFDMDDPSQHVNGVS